MGRAAVLVCLGLTMGRLLWSGSFGFFLQQRMRIPLLLATIALLLLGVYEGIMGSREETANREAGRRWVAPKVGWLMVLPVIVIYSVAPTGLGAASADRVDSFTPLEVDVAFSPLEDTTGPLEMRVFDFVDRAVWDDEKSIEDRVIRLEGLVVNNPDVPNGFLLTRFLVSCCAADGVPIQVALPDVDTKFEDDTWVVADLVWRVPDVPYIELTQGEWYVEADLVNIEVEPNPPTDAYESPYSE